MHTNLKKLIFVIISIGLIITIGKRLSRHRNIYEIHSLSDIVSFIKNKKPDELLIIFDVDGVLTIPSDPVLQPQSFENYKKDYEKLIGSLNKNQKNLLNHLIISCGPSSLIEEEIKIAVEKWQDKGIRVMAFTAAQMGPIVGVINSFSDWRYGELKRLGIDFTRSFPPENNWSYLMPKYDSGFSKGILYSNGLYNEKGPVLLDFLKKSNFKPKTVLMIDDKIKNLISIGRYLNRNSYSVELIAIHYNHNYPLTIAPSKKDFINKIMSLMKLL